MKPANPRTRRVLTGIDPWDEDCRAASLAFGDSSINARRPWVYLVLELGNEVAGDLPGELRSRVRAAVGPRSRAATGAKGQIVFVIARWLPLPDSQ